MSRTKFKHGLDRLHIALLALLCIAGSQAVLAGHQFQHNETLVVESCAVCLQLEQLDSPQLAERSSTPLPINAGELAAAVHGSVPAAPAFHYASRAPPTI